VPLLLREPLSPDARAWFEADPGITVCWSTPVECVSALARAEREGRLQPAEVRDAVAGLRLLRNAWSEVDAISPMHDIAERLVRTHPFRASDAFQLAAAILAADGTPSSLAIVTLDTRLAEAASREGFDVVGTR
jgi:predicted nucleic acid-binding protein